MKNNNSIGAVIAKIVVALLAVAGAVYVIVAFGDKIVAWVKKVAATLPCFKAACDGGECIDESCEEAEEAEEEAAEEAGEEAGEAAEEAAPADGVVAEENEFEN